MVNSDNHLAQVAINANKELHRAINRICSLHQQQLLDIRKVAESVQIQVQVPSQMQQAFQGQVRALSQVGEAFRQLARDLQKQNQEEKEALAKFAELGWYCDPDMSHTALVRCARAIDKGDTDEVVEVFREYFQEQLGIIEEKLTVSYPHRRQVLHDAFNAHRERKYNLSVPVFLTQADGMWGEKFSSNLFSKNGRKTIVGDDISQIKFGLFQSIVSLFLTPIPLWKSESERDSTFDELNRHQVLHGEDCNYGTEQNSLKVISFLGCLCWILNYKDEQAP